MAMYFRLRHLNNEKDRLYGPAGTEDQLDVTDLGDKHPAFRYVL